MAENMKNGADMTPEELNLHIAHVGINMNSGEEAEALAKRFCALLNLPYSTTPVSSKAGEVVEVMNASTQGAHGHIAFHADDVDAAEQYLVARGFTANDATRRRNPDGSTFLVYFNEELGGFAIHLTTENA